MRWLWFILILSLGCRSFAGEPDLPVPRSVSYSWMSIADWYHRHADDVALAEQGKADIIFLGDSITEGWQGEQRQAIFKKYFSRYASANFGIGGDQTQNLLWRLQNSIKGNLNPKVVVLLIGVNNFLHSKHQPSQVSRGVASVLAQVKTNYPRAKILLHGILPYDELPEYPSRQLVAATNKQLKMLADNQSVYFYDFGDVFLDDNGKIPKALMSDFLHPTAEGMDRWGALLSEVINAWFESFSSQDGAKHAN